MRILVTLGDEQTVETKALVDSGAGGIFIDSTFIQEHKIPTTPLSSPIRVFNVDGSRNKQGQITHFTWAIMKVGEQALRTRFLVTGLGKESVILGLPWLKEINPRIDWRNGTIDISTEKP